MTAWSNLPPALPPHGTVLAWARGCRCDECEREYKRFVSELALRGPLRFPARPEPRKRCRNLAFPQHFGPTHLERRIGP